MKKFTPALTLLLVSIPFAQMALAQSTVPAKFWGIQFHNSSSTYPVSGGPTFQIFRFWDTQTSWHDMQTGASTYDFSNLDSWMAQLNIDFAGNFDVIYTFGKTPAFISINPTYNCGGPSVPAGSCMPPSDVTCSGASTAGTGGTDGTLINYVIQLWSHIHSMGWDSGRTWYFETWNEPNLEGFWASSYIITNWCGNDATGPRRIIARIAYDIAHAVSPRPSALKFVSPPPSEIRSDQTSSGGWWYEYLNGDEGTWGKTKPCTSYSGTNPCGGGQFADIIAVHGYTNASALETPDDICCGTGTQVSNAVGVMNSFGQGGKNLVITEASWQAYCPTGTCPNSALPVAYTARYYTLLASTAQTMVKMFAWYNYDIWGPFWCSSTYGNTGECNGLVGSLSPSGIALAQMQTAWGYAGGTFAAGGCTTVPACSSHNFRVCGLTEGGTGKQAQTVWLDAWSDTTASCSYTAPAGTQKYKTLDGIVTTYTGPVNVGATPILFEGP